MPHSAVLVLPTTPNPLGYATAGWVWFTLGHAKGTSQQAPRPMCPDWATTRRWPASMLAQSKEERSGLPLWALSLWASSLGFLAGLSLRRPACGGWHQCATVLVVFREVG